MKKITFNMPVTIVSNTNTIEVEDNATPEEINTLYVNWLKNFDATWAEETAEEV